MDHLNDLKKWVSEQADKDIKTTYESYKKIKEFKDIGYLLEHYVLEGGEVSKDPIRNFEVLATDIVASLDDNILYRKGNSFRVRENNAVYYLDFEKGGDWHFDTVHPEGIVGTDYLTIAEVTTTSSGMVGIITDKRGVVGGLRLKDEFGLEQYVKFDDLDKITKQVTPSMTTAEIQTILDSYRKILFVGGLFEINPIFIKSNTEITLSPNTIIQARPGYGLNDRMVSIRDAQNVVIYGNKAILRMLKPQYTTGEQRHCLAILGSDNVTVHDISTNDSGGDGVYIGAGTTQKYCVNVNLYSINSNNNKRQGLSLIAADGFLADGCTFSNTEGTFPKAGVDIEPNNPTDILRRIRFARCKSIGNEGNGFEIMLGNLRDTSEHVDIVFEQCYTENNDNGFITKYARDGVKGTITMIDCTAREDRLNAYTEMNCSVLAVRNNYIRCAAIDANTGNSSSSLLAYASSFYIRDIDNGSLIPNVIGNSYLEDCTSYDTRTTKTISRAYAVFFNSTAIASDITFRNCKSEGQTVSEFEIRIGSKNIFNINDKTKIQQETTTGTVSMRHIGYEITNTSAAMNILRTLPVAQEGIRFGFKIDSTFSIRIAPQASAQILTLTNAAGASIISTVKGSNIEFQGRADGNWDVINVVGTWTQV